MVTEKKVTRFAVGDAVKIRKAEEIQQTLDGDCTLEGCLMAEQMYGYCGDIKKIIRIVRNIFDEAESRMYEARPTMYILEDLICDGEDHAFDHRCDRSCYLLWHEKWLEDAL